MLSVTYKPYAEYSYAECLYAEGHYAECLYAEGHYAECRYAECHYAEFHYAKCRYAECRGAILRPVYRQTQERNFNRKFPFFSNFSH
jgi:hypothetical protein